MGLSLRLAKDDIEGTMNDDYPVTHFSRRISLGFSSVFQSSTHNWHQFGWPRTSEANSRADDNLQNDDWDEITRNIASEIEISRDKLSPQTFSSFPLLKIVVIREVEVKLHSCDGF